MPRKKTNLLSAIGERGLLRRYETLFSTKSNSRLLIPSGDDCALAGSSARTLLSIDGLSENTHFRLRWARAVKRLLGVSLGRALGWKLMGSALSDLSAMGDFFDPWALLYLGAPAQTPLVFLEDLARGIMDVARRCDCAIAGGDTVRASQLQLAATVGASSRGTVLTRKGARPGDVLAVVGTVGDAQLGLQALEKKRTFKSAHAKKFVRRFFEPPLLMKEGQQLAAVRGVTSLMDLSDPLQESIALLTAASQVGAEVYVDQTPQSKEAARYQNPAESFQLSGEDYGLLFTASPVAIPLLKKRIRFTILGTVTKKRQLLFLNHGRPWKASAAFRHFS